MKRYIGTKIIHAVPEKHSESGREGYRVRYADGYESWSPQEAFDDAYRECDAMTFGLALECLKKGMHVCRAGWNGKGMFLFLVSGSVFKVNRAPLLGIYPEGTEINYRPHIDMKTVDGEIVPWVASQTDVLAEDWRIVI